MAGGLGVGGYFLYDYLANKDSGTSGTGTTTTTTTTGGGDLVVGGDSLDIDAIDSLDIEGGDIIDDVDDAKGKNKPDTVVKVVEKVVKEYVPVPADDPYRDDRYNRPPRPEQPSNFYAKGAGMFPWASTERINYGDLDGYSAWQLKIMRNEIYARHGYIFETDDMRSYFNQQRWYRPVSRNVRLTNIEQQNVNVIKQAERNR